MMLNLKNLIQIIKRRASIIHQTLNLYILAVSVLLSCGGAQLAFADSFEKKWVFDLNNFSATDTVQAQPKEFLGKLFLIDGAGNLLSLDKKTGQLLYKRFLGINAGRRGFEINLETGEIVITANERLFILNAQNGKVISSRNTIKSVVSPIITDKCYIVLGSTGDIQCHDKNSDIVLWKTSLGKTARIWSNAVFFQKNDLIYFVTSNPGGIIYKQDRVDNYSSSLIAITASSGSIAFSKRMVLNDVWDYDGVGKPILVENYQQDDGVELDLIIGTNKTGTIFAVNASNGKDVKDQQFKTVEFPVGLNGLVDQTNSQIIPSWPNRVADIKIEKDDIRTDQLDEFKLRHAKFQEFLRPSLHYDLVIKGLHGGPEWHGGIYYNDELNGQKLLAYPSNNEAWILRINYVREHPLLLKMAFKLLGIARQFKLLEIASQVKTRLRKTFNNIKGFFPKNSDAIPTIEGNVESRWNQNFWSNSSINNKVISFYYKYFDYDSYNKNYRQNCASCHGFDRNGKYQSELNGDGFVPSLVGYTLTEKFKFGQNYQNLKKLHGNVSFPSEAEVKLIFSDFHQLDKSLSNQNKLKQKGFWQVLLGKDSLPLNKAPWGSVNIIDLNTGELKESLTVGKSRDNSGKTVNSSIIFGGLGKPTSQGKTMLTGTVDSAAYYISLDDFKVENVLNLKRSGSVNPFLTKIDNCEAWIFVETGGRFSYYDKSKNGFSVEAFINKDNCSLDY